MLVDTIDIVADIKSLSSLHDKDTVPTEDIYSTMTPDNMTPLKSVSASASHRKTNISTASNSNPLIVVRSESKFDEAFGFLTKFNLVLADNTSIQFCVLMQVLQTIVKQIDSKKGIFVSFFKVFLNKYFLPEVQSIDAEIQQSQPSQLAQAASQYILKQQTALKIDKLLKEMRYFFHFMG